MWYINKSGNVEGPFSSEQIEKRVKLNMLRSLDRISEDKTTWLYVRDTGFWGSGQAKKEPAGPEMPVPVVDVPRNTSQGRRWRPVVVVAASAAVVLGFGSLVLFMAKGVFTGSQDPLSAVYQEKQSAVGLVTLTFQEKGGGWETAPIGTAFAIGRNKFVTNAHVAYALKNGFEENLVTPVLKRFFYEEAMKQGKSYDRYLYDIGESGIEQARSGLLEFWKECGVKIRDIEIRLNHRNGKSFRVAKVQVHPRYNPADVSGEFDVAILEIDGSTDCYFDVATKRELLALRPGIPVASAGFPMEGLSDTNIEKPEASYAAGYIKKTTDFDYKDAGAEYNRSVTHSIPAAGGASGSPIFNAKGKIVAVLWGGSSHGLDANGARIGSAALQNFAVRIDQIDDVGVPVPWNDWVNAPTH